MSISLPSASTGINPDFLNFLRALLESRPVLHLIFLLLQIPASSLAPIILFMTFFMRDSLAIEAESFFQVKFSIIFCNIVAGLRNIPIIPPPSPNIPTIAAIGPRFFSKDLNVTGLFFFPADG